MVRAKRPVDGSRAGPAVALVVIAVRRRAAPESGYQFARAVSKSARHFADHCASCHANDGSGNTEIGGICNPPAPDMRLAATRQLSDGELCYIIHNGVRWTGMPGMGANPAMTTTRTAGSWWCSSATCASLTPDELRDMERFNPGAMLIGEEEKEEQEFLNGGPEDGPRNTDR